MAIRKLCGVVVFFLAATAWTVRWYIDGSKALARRSAPIEDRDPGIDGRYPDGGWSTTLLVPLDSDTAPYSPGPLAAPSDGDWPAKPIYERY